MLPSAVDISHGTIVLPSLLKDVFFTQQLWQLANQSSVRRLLLQVLQTLVQPTNRFSTANAKIMRKLGVVNLCVAVIEVGTCILQL